MKITIEGFSQIELVKRGLDLQDALILRWFVDFKDTDKMVSEIIGNEKYYWVKYEGLLEDLPILNIKKDSLRRRFFRLTDIGILKHITKKKGGTFSMYAIGKEFKYLIDIDLEAYGKKIAGGTEKISDPCGKKVGTKDSSTNNSSIKKTQKPITDFGMSKKEKAILFTATIEKVTLTKYFIQELASKYTTEQVQNFIIETAKAKKVQEIEQDGAYIRGIIKKQGLVKSTKKKIEKKIIEIVKIEEPKQKEDRQILIDKFCAETNCTEINMPHGLKKIINKTLKGLNYEQIG